MLKSKKIGTDDALRMRVATLKTQFPKGFDYTPLYQYEFGSQTEEQLTRIRMVWNLRETDETITANLETIAGKIK